jgi:formate/nitrite transporter FocA (FNT family)
MVVELDEWTRGFSKSILAGLVGGLLVSFSHLFVGQLVEVFPNLNRGWVKVLGITMVSITLFLIVVLTLIFSQKK